MKKILLTLFLFIILLLCSCGHEHSFNEATCEAPKICTTCGETEGEALGHSFSEANCTDPARCERCGKTGETNPENHIYNEATCTLAAYCKKCGISKGEPLGHEWENGPCNEPRGCTRCIAINYETGEHNWVRTHCLLPRECSYCNVKEEKAPGHKYSEATCTESAKCEVCGDETGEPKGHSWKEATCAAPKTCESCGETVGEKMSHSWSQTGYEEPNKCLDGKYIYTCIYGETMEILIPSTGDYYHYCDENGLCSVCNTQLDVSKMSLSELVVATNLSIPRAGVYTSTETTSKIYKTIEKSELNIPFVDLNGDISRASKTNIVTVDFAYDDGSGIDFTCKVEVKVQGASSAGYPKKNYNIKLIEEDGSKHKVTLVDSWGKQHKYCLKANYVDFSQARNVVSAKIFGDIVRERNDELASLPNGGAIDGYPVLVYNNGKYQGLYTLNIPKDKWMFGMKDTDEKNQAILMGIDWKDSVAFRALMSTTNIGSSGWELEFASNEESLIDNSTTWVAESMNRLIDFVMKNDGEAFKNGISEYADVDKCIDSMLYTFVICADDNISKNILWATLDGKVWFSSVYDMDGTWGLKWNGQVAFNENTHLISNLGNGGADAGRSHANYNLLWEKIYINFFDRVVARYKELRAGALSYNNIASEFRSFFAKIPVVAYEADKAKWTGIPSPDTNNITQILDFAQKRLGKLDEILLS